MPENATKTTEPGTTVYPTGKPVTEAELETLFTYHTPNNTTLARYDALRGAAKNFAKAVLANTPPGPDQTAAIRKIREAVMTANAAVACAPVTDRTTAATT